MKNRKSKGIYSQLFSQFLLTSLVPILTLGLVIVLFARQFSMSSLKYELSSSTGTAAEGFTRELDACQAGLEMLAQSQEVQDLLATGGWDDSSMIEVNQKSYLILAGRSKWMDVQFVDLNGRILHAITGQVGTPGNSRPYWGIMRALQNSDGTIYYPGIYGAEDRGLTIATPVRQDGKALGYTMLGISSKALEEILAPYSQQLPVNYILMNENNYLLLDQIGMEDQTFLPLELREKLRSSQDDCISYELNGDPQLICVKDCTAGVKLLSAASVGLVVSSNKELISLGLLVCAISILFSLTAARKLSRRIVEPIQTICETMETIENGEADVKIPELWDNEFGLIARGFNQMLSTLMDQFRMNMERQDRLRLAELKNLQAQISPHFLYNTLESIKYMARLGMNSEIDTMISKLGILLRSGMNFKQDMIPLRSELKVVESYVAIQQIRYPGKFTFTNSVEESVLECMVPNLVIQPLVENAIVHGIETKVGTGTLVISSQCCGKDMIIQVYDDGEGISPSKLGEIFSEEEKSVDLERSRESIGMANVHRRLQLYYGEGYGLEVQSVPGEYTKVSARMPMIKGEQQHV